jgi:Heparinase II/III-like protein
MLPGERVTSTDQRGRRGTLAVAAAIGTAFVFLSASGTSRGVPNLPLARHPRLLVAETDPFTSVSILRAKLAAGQRPSDDLPGWALTWLLTGDETFARRALEDLRADPPAHDKGSDRYMRTLRRALAFDWLYDYPGFDAGQKDAVAAGLVQDAAKMLALPSLSDPKQASYHNHTARELALATFALAAVEGHPSVEAQAGPLREQARRALDNILETSELVDPQGAYHESTDYMRITWAPLALMAELRRTTTGEDPARRWGVFRNMGPTYLYKVLPDGSEARDDDDEFPHLDPLDNVVLGYAVHRFKDPLAAWLQQDSGWLPKEWRIPVLEFLWSDASVVPRDPATTTEAELPRSRLFPGVDHLVMRSGWEPGATWIEFACGPYFAKHDHLDAGQFTIYHKGYLAIDAGADYTDTESPHYLNHYRRTIAHNTMLVYQPGERFFWGENLWPAANDGGQRMDSSRFWNSVRSLEDWRRTRDLWDRARIEAFDRAPERYVYARGDATRAYQPSKVSRFVRELLWLPKSDVLFILDRVGSRDPSYKKVWLLHGVEEPRVVDASGATPSSVGQGGTLHRDAELVTFTDADGRLRVHPLLPRDREVVVRGGPGFEFWTPGDERGGGWGSGKNWPLDPPEGGPLPSDPYLKKMWLTFWGSDMERLSPSNRRAVVPGGWRVEISPAAPAANDVFLNALEIGDRGADPVGLDAVEGYRLAGAVLKDDAAVFFSTATAIEAGEATLPDVASRFLVLAGLQANATYDLQLTSNYAPGAPLWRYEGRANDAGVIAVDWAQRNGRLRLRRLGAADQGTP